LAFTQTQFLGMTPDTFAREIIHSYLSGKRKGKMAKIEQSYVERELERRKQPAIPQHL